MAAAEVEALFFLRVSIEPIKRRSFEPQSSIANSDYCEDRLKHVVHCYKFTRVEDKGSSFVTMGRNRSRVVLTTKTISTPLLTMKWCLTDTMKFFVFGNRRGDYQKCIFIGVVISYCFKCKISNKVFVVIKTTLVVMIMCNHVTIIVARLQI